MFSDIVGYTAIMGRDEREGLRAVGEHRAHLRAMLPRFNGRLIGEVGDGTLSSFHSAVDAVNCARELQATLVERPDLRLRVGIHVGDVVFTDNTVLGDGVNVASRIHELAPPGGCCISERVYEEIRNKPEFQVKDLGEKRLKNVPRPMHVYALRAADAYGEPWSSSGLPSGDGKSIAQRRALAAGVAALLVAAAVMVIARSWWVGPVLTTPPTAARPIRSIAVLPLDNFSGDPKQEYFADGMTEELTTDLASISGLRVISRGSAMRYKGAQRPPTPKIAKLLNVDAVVEGSVMRVGDQVRITAQLIDAPADRHLWAKSYERNSRDVLALQDEVALAIAKEINVELTPKEQARFAGKRTVNPEAYEAYLKGRYFLGSYSEERVRKAIEQFERAIKADPNFAPAYTGLADAYGTFGSGLFFLPTEATPKAKAAAEKALQLDDTLAEAHTSLAGIKVWYDFDLGGGENEFLRSIALNPNYSEAHHLYGYFLVQAGRFDESLAEMRRAAQLDPLSAGIAGDVSLPLIFKEGYEAAKEQCRKALELDPGFFLGQYYLGWTDVEAGKFKEAVPKLEKAKAMNSPPFVTGLLGYAYAKSGNRAKAESTIAELNQMSSRRFVDPFGPALVYLGLGDNQRALDLLEKTYKVRSQDVLWLKVDKIFDPLRSESRFIALLKKVGFDK